MWRYEVIAASKNEMCQKLNIARPTVDYTPRAVLWTVDARACAHFEVRIYLTKNLINVETIDSRKNRFHAENCLRECDGESRASCT